MNPKSTVKIIEKDSKKLTKEYAKTKVYIEQIIKEQERVISVAEKAKEKVDKKLKLHAMVLKRYVEGKELDEEGLKVKKEYERLLVNRTTLEKTILIAVESIEKAKLNII